MRAKHIKRLKGWRGDAALYQLDPPYRWADYDGEDLGEFEFVVVSSVSVPFTGPETLIFPAREDGETQSLSEMPGSYRGGYSHEEALQGLGYEVSE